VFETGYEALKKTTGDFRRLKVGALLKTVYEVPIAFIVLRAMLGFTPPEWAYVATARTQVKISQGAIRALDRKIRLEPLTPLKEKPSGLTALRIEALVRSACEML